jgi:hypothetical protein
MALRLRPLTIPPVLLPTGRGAEEEEEEEENEDEEDPPVALAVAGGGARGRGAGRMEAGPISSPTGILPPLPMIPPLMFSAADRPRRRRVALFLFFFIKPRKIATGQSGCGHENCLWEKASSRHPWCMRCMQGSAIIC